ncbi:EamA family transporter [Kurthia huakuii]|uniref:EamA family transporter n=1 Tax=Kurthia huakuii TaxID=1421019 RepID=UPI000497653D|nr:EamA family transporter [Kurthia huakuii]MBM7700138.1 drug/metabolite transporter (DMT)-like permease [Kurthia huakuii]
MWFLFAILTWILWGSANLFYKKASSPNDRYSHAKIAIMVGLVMGIHATIYWITADVQVEVQDFITYLPVSALYISSMVFGYVGLRYLELSIVAPLQNASGAITVLLFLIFFPKDITWLHITGFVLILAGILWLAFIEKKYDDLELRRKGIQVDSKYRYGFIALTFPLLYALLDGLGTFADGVVLDELALIKEGPAIIAYEYTWFTVAVVYFIYLKVKGADFKLRDQKNGTIAAVLETAGQFFYTYALASASLLAAPIIASFFVFSMILGRIFLKEKLSKAQYGVIFIIFIGIMILGYLDV